ncbi:hypothetical protein B7486_55315, partial [cyanobacterium TDX16]
GLRQVRQHRACAADAEPGGRHGPVPRVGGRRPGDPGGLGDDVVGPVAGHLLRADGRGHRSGVPGPAGGALQRHARDRTGAPRGRGAERRRSAAGPGRGLGRPHRGAPALRGGELLVGAGDRSGGEPLPPPAANAHRFPPLAPERLAVWADFGRWPDRVWYPSFLGLQVEEIREDYARMRLPYRPELEQPAEVVHGGAITSLIDTVVVPAVGGPYDARPEMLTLSLNVSFLGAVRKEDAVAEGWVTQRGRSIVFCEAVVHTASGAPAASASLVYKVRLAKP